VVLTTRKTVQVLCLALALVLGAVPSVRADETGPVVRAVIFHSPECPACRVALGEVLPPIEGEYGSQLDIARIDTTTDEGSELYLSAAAHFGVAREDRFIPMLYVGDSILVGPAEIEQQLPVLVDDGLAAGGIDWPAIPGLDLDRGQTLADLIAQDMPGNAIAIVVLSGMVLAVVRVSAQGFRALRRRERRPRASVPEPARWRIWAVPALCLLGVAVAGYLAYVEIAHVEAACGPVGDCNVVQQSKYVYLFGVIPVAVVGVAGYLAMLTVWVLGRRESGRPAELAQALLLGLAGLGTLFSIYLTSLEPFVLGATCMWCLLLSADVTLILLLSARPGWETLRQEQQARHERT